MDKDVRDGLGDMSPEDLRRYGYEIVDSIANYFEHIDEHPVLSEVESDWLRRTSPLPLQKTVKILARCSGTSIV